MGTGVSPDRIATRSIELYSVSAVSLFTLNSALLHFGLRSILHIHPVCHMRSRKQASIAPLSSSLCTHSLITQAIDNILPYFFFLRKEVIQPHLPIRLPCYDFTPVIGPTFGSSLLTVGSLTSGVTNSHGVTGGVYKTRERIHRDMLIRDY